MECTYSLFFPKSSLYFPYEYSQRSVIIAFTHFTIVEVLISVGRFYIKGSPSFGPPPHPDLWPYNYVMLNGEGPIHARDGQGVHVVCGELLLAYFILPKPVVVLEKASDRSS